MDTNPPNADRDPFAPNPDEGQARSYPSNPDLPPAGSELPPAAPDVSPYDSAPLRGPHAETDFTASTEPSAAPSSDPFAERPLPPLEEPFAVNIPPGSATPFGETPLGAGPAIDPAGPTVTSSPGAYDLPPVTQTVPPAGPPPAPPNNRTRNCLIIAGVILLLGLCALCGLFALGGSLLSRMAPELEAIATQVVDPDSGGFTGGGETISVFDISVGHCFDDQAGDEDLIDEVRLIPCSEPHDNEVYAIFDYPAESDAPFPGDDELDEYIENQCTDVFEDYVGISYSESELYYFPIKPTEQTWADGDREIVCTLYDGDLAKLEGSMQGSGR